MVKELPIEGTQAGASRPGGHRHKMHEEIFQQPQAISRTLAGRLGRQAGDVDWSGTGLDQAALAQVRHVLFLGSGTAYHAGLVGDALVKQVAGLPARTEPASEFRFGEFRVPPGTLAVAVSQSGETKDTLAALAAARQRGAAAVLAVTNAPGSAITREADFTFITQAGTEEAVASTKAYMAQLVAVVLLAVGLGRAQETLPREEAARILAGLAAMPDQVAAVLAEEEAVAQAGRDLARRRHAFYIGRQMDWITAHEGQLKLKETSYIHAEACAAGEFRHGPMALIDSDYSVVGIVTRPDLEEMMARNFQEVRRWGAQVVAVAPAGSRELARHADHFLPIPPVEPIFGPMLSVVPLQLLAYHAAVALGRNVDQPRHLVKSLTED